MKPGRTHTDGTFTSNSYIGGGWELASSAKLRCISLRIEDGVDTLATLADVTLHLIAAINFW
jgi:hypothetical protein